MRNSPSFLAVPALTVLTGALLLIGCQTQPESGSSAEATSGAENLSAPPSLEFPEGAADGFREIVFLSLDGNIATMDRNGENRVSVTRREGPIGVDAFHFSLPRLSPDGTKIAFMGHDRVGAENRIRNILYVADSERQEIVAVHSSLENAPFFIDFSPNGESLTFLSSSPDSALLALQHVGIDGTGYRVLADGRPLFYDWSQSGDAIATHVGGSAVQNSAGGTSGTIGIVPINGGNGRPTILDQVPTYFQVPPFSPDGSMIAGAVLSPEGNSSISLFNRQGGHVRTIADLDGFAAMDWSPEGRRLAYIEGSNNPFTGVVGTLHVENLEAAPQTISMQSNQSDGLSVNRVAAFFWSPDGEKLALFRPIPVGDDGTSRMNRYFRLTVLWVESGETVNYGVFPASMSFVTRVIPHFDQYQSSAQVWSPDSTHIVVNTISGDQPRPAIYIVDLANRNNPQQIAQGEMAFFAAQQ